MSRVPATKVADPQQTIAELQRQLAARTAELDEAQQLIERTAERDEGEAQKAAIAEVLGVINSSAGDLPLVFDAILEKAMRLCETNGGYFLRYQDGNHLLAAGRGLQPALAAFLSQQDQPSAGSPAAMVAQGAPYIHIADLKDDDHYRSGAPRRRAIVDLGGLRTGLPVPMRRDDVLLGTLNLGRSEVGPFTDKQIALLQNFAAQAVIAMENAWLITETHEALEQAGVQGSRCAPGSWIPAFAGTTNNY